MIKVECDACKSPYQIEERRIPATGLKMRCSKCGSSILVQKPGLADAGAPDLGEVDLPVPVAPRPKGGTEPMMPQPKPGGIGPAPLPPVKPAVTAPKPTVQLGKPKPKEPPSLGKNVTPMAGSSLADELEVDLPLPAFGEIDLPSPAKPTVRQMAQVTPNDDLEVMDLPSPAKLTVRQMAAPVHEPSGDGDEEDAALNAIEMSPPQGKPTVRQMAASEPEGFEIDLPAPAKAVPAKPAPAKPAPAKPAPVKPAAVKQEAPREQKPTTPAQPAAKGFGEIDLPSPVKPALPKAAKPKEEIDLPTTKGFGEIDLPAPQKPSAPKAAKPKEENDLPATKGFGEIDLPTAQKTPPAKAARGFGEIDLPAPAPQRPKAHSSGEIDLPMISGSEVSAAFGTIDLPEIDLGGGGPAAFGEIELPPGEAGAAFSELDLPLPEGQEPTRPAKGKAAFPGAAPAASEDLGFADFGEIDLPLASDPPPPMLAGAKATAQPPVAKSQATMISGSGTFALDNSFDATFGAAPADRPAAPAAAKAAPFPNSGEEFSLSDAGIDLSGEGLLDRSAPGPKSGAARPSHSSAPPPIDHDGSAGIGDEVELLAGDGSAIDPNARRDKLTKTSRTGPDAAKPEAGKKPKKSRARMYLIGAAVLFAIGGGSLALLPDIGPFGAHMIVDKLNASDDAASLLEAEKRIQTMLEEDTFASSASALSSIKAAYASRPRHRTTAAYAAYIALSRGVRHGRRGDDETFAKQLLGAGEATPSHELTLALAAQHALAGKIDAARRVARNAVSEAPGDIDAACLLGEIELAAGSKEAVEVWKKAVAIKKSGRSLYGLARAENAAGDFAAAEKDARAALEASPKHAGALVLLASILGHDNKQEAEAIKLLGKVTAEGDVRSAANDTQIVAAFVEAGRVHLSRSRITAAEESFAAALKIDPRSVSALLGDAELFYRSGRYSQALLRFEEAAKVDDANLTAKIGAAKTMLSLERMKDAKELLTKLHTAKPDVALVAYWLGRAEDTLGNKKEAETIYRESIKLGGTSPETVEAYVALSALLAALGRGDDAQAMLAEASAKFTDLAALHRAKGDVLLAQGRYAEARTELETALSKEDDLGTRFRLGVTVRRMRDFDEAAKVFDAIAAIDKDFPSLSLERGLLYEETGQSEKALEMYGEALKKAPNDIDLKLRVGSTQVIAGHAEQAESILREVMKDRAGSADANHFLGRALLLKGGQAAEAIRYLTRAVEIDGNRAEYYLYVAWAANELGQFPKAEQSINKALELDHELADAYWQRGVLYSKQGRIKDALVDLETALAKRPSRFEAYATMALCHQELAQTNEAIADWQKAIAGNGSVAEWHYRLGKIYDGQASTLLATPELEKAVALLDAKPVVPQGWPADAYFLYAEAIRGNGALKDKAIKAYQRFLDLAPIGNAYRTDAEKALKLLGAPPR